MARTKFILIDYENVHTFSPADLAVLKAEEVMVKLFLGVHNREIGVDLVGALLPIGCRVELVRLRTAGTNALDLLIAFYVGKLWREAPESSFYIISRDADYDPLIKNLKAIGVDVHRRTSIADVENDVPAGIASLSDLVATARAALCKYPHRPSTLKTLRNLLNVNMELSDDQMKDLLGALTRSGIVQIAGKKVSYDLAGQLQPGDDAAPPGQGGLAPPEAESG